MRLALEQSALEQVGYLACNFARSRSSSSEAAKENEYPISMERIEMTGSGAIVPYHTCDLLQTTSASGSKHF